jgi:peptide deformylase
MFDLTLNPSPKERDFDLTLNPSPKERDFDKLHEILLLMLFFFLVVIPSQAQNTASPLSQAEIDLVMEADSSQIMRVLKITNPKDSVFLRQKCHPVKVNPKDAVLQHFIQRMYKTVIHPDIDGVGIAAIQVGLHRQVAWVQRFDKAGYPFEVYFNLAILQSSDSTKITPQGCLSVPDRRGAVKRPATVVVEYDKLDGTHHQETITGFTAVIFQHEIDHLNGILYIDHLLSEIKDQKNKDVHPKTKKKKKP